MLYNWFPKNFLIRNFQSSVGRLLARGVSQNPYNICQYLNQFFSSISSKLVNESIQIFATSAKQITLYSLLITSLVNEFKSIKNPRDDIIGILIAYKVLLHHTVSRLLESIDEKIYNTKYPLTLKISDGLDGSGSLRVYNQLHEDPNFNTKNHILFGLKVLSLTDNTDSSLFI